MAGTQAGADAVTEALPAGSVVVTAAGSSATEPTAISAELLDRVRAVPGVLIAGGTYGQPIGVRIRSHSQDDRPPALRGLLFTSQWDPSLWRIVAGSAPDDTRSHRGRLPVALSAAGLLSAPASATRSDFIHLQGGRRPRSLLRWNPAASCETMPGPAWMAPAFAIVIAQRRDLYAP